MTRRRHRESLVVRLARRMARRPCNRDGSDKTWVLRVMRRLERLFAEAREVRRR